MIPAMTSSDDALRQFATRPWDEVERLKERYWATDEMTPSERLRVADAMRQAMSGSTSTSKWPARASNSAVPKRAVSVYTIDRMLTATAPRLCDTMGAVVAEPEVFIEALPPHSE